MNEGEIYSVETDEAFVGTDPEVTIRRLRDSVHGTARESSFDSPLLADVLRHVSVRIDRVRGSQETDHCQSGQNPTPMLQSWHHGKYSNLSMTTSASF